MSLDVRPFYNSEEHPDSPKPPNPQFRGVLISAPAQNTLSARSPLVLLRGSYRIQGSNYPANDRIRLVAIDIASKRQYAAFAGQRDPSPDAPPPPSDPPNVETVRKMIFSGFFNTDLMATLGLPWTNATYKVRAEFGTIPSNEIPVQIIVQP